MTASLLRVTCSVEPSLVGAMTASLLRVTSSTSRVVLCSFTSDQLTPCAMSKFDAPVSDDRRAEAQARSAKIAARHAQALRSSLPDDPTLGADASTLRESYLTPLEVLLEIANDTSLPVAMRVAAARGAAPYCHRPQTVTQKLQGDGAQLVVGVDPATLAKLSPEDLDAAEKVLMRIVARGG